MQDYIYAHEDSFMNLIRKGCWPRSINGSRISLQAFGLMGLCFSRISKNTIKSFNLEATMVCISMYFYKINLNMLQRLVCWLFSQYVRQIKHYIYCLLVVQHPIYLVKIKKNSPACKHGLCFIASSPHDAFQMGQHGWKLTNRRCLGLFSDVIVLHEWISCISQDWSKAKGVNWPPNISSHNTT